MKGAPLVRPRPGSRGSFQRGGCQRGGCRKGAAILDVCCQGLTPSFPRRRQLCDVQAHVRPEPCTVPRAVPRPVLLAVHHAADKERLSNLANAVMLLVNEMVKRSEQQLNDSGKVCGTARKTAWTRGRGEGERTRTSSLPMPAQCDAACVMRHV
eukprot:360407-Chlamydomonas_euryale.AAC.5